MRFKVAPLSGGFMLVSIFGFLFATLFLSKFEAAIDWAFSIGFLSVIMFIASVISMTFAPVEDELLIDEHHTQRKKRVISIDTRKKPEQPKTKKTTSTKKKVASKRKVSGKSNNTKKKKR